MFLIRKAFKRLHYPVDVIAQCVRWYLAYALSLRNREEMMAKRGIVVDHSTLFRWIIRLTPLLGKAFRRHKRRVGRRWQMDETYIKIKGQWQYPYPAVDSNGQSIDFLLPAKRDAATTLRFFRKAIRHQDELRSSLLIKVAPTRPLWPHSTPPKQKKKPSPFQAK